MLHAGMAVIAPAGTEIAIASWPFATVPEIVPVNETVGATTTSAGPVTEDPFCVAVHVTANGVDAVPNVPFHVPVKVSVGSSVLLPQLATMTAVSNAPNALKVLRRISVSRNV